MSGIIPEIFGPSIRGKRLIEWLCHAGVPACSVETLRNVAQISNELARKRETLENQELKEDARAYEDVLNCVLFLGSLHATMVLERKAGP
jgi:hypothetical protein